MTQKVTGSAAPPMGTVQSTDEDMAPANAGKDTASPSKTIQSKDVMEEGRARSSWDSAEHPRLPSETPSGSQGAFPAGVMQFSTPFAAPKAVAKALKPVQLNQAQSEAKAQLEQLPAWKTLTEAQQAQVARNLSNFSGKRLEQEVEHMKDQFKSIETLSGHAGWKELSPEQQQKITDQVLRESGNALKQDTASTEKKLGDIENLGKQGAWNVLSPAQKQQLTDPVLKLSGTALKNHIANAEKRLDTIKSFSNLGSLETDQQQKIADRILKAPDRDLKQTTANLQGTIDFTKSMKDNKIDAGKTFDKLVALEKNDPKAFQKMTGALTEAQRQLNGAKDKTKAGTDIRDMIDLSLDRTIGSRGHLNAVEGKGEVASRFLKQYEKDPADFDKVRDLLKDAPEAKLLVHWHHPERIGIDIAGTKSVQDSDYDKVFSDKKTPAAEQTRYKHALQTLHEIEGKYDSMNAYDDGIISLGIRQWSTHEGSLIEPMEKFQKADPEKFKELLPGVEIKNHRVFYNGKPITLEHDKDSVKPLLENLKESEIVELSKMFNKLGKDPGFQAAQVRVAVDRIDSVLNMNVGSHTIGDYVKSDRGLGHIIGFDTGRPSWTKPAFAAGVRDVANFLGLKSEAPSRDEMLKALKEKVEKDKDFQAALQEKFGKDILDKLKNESGREDFLERRLSEAFRDHFIGFERSSPDREAYKKRFDKIDAQYN